jgi:hypothetical protein
LRDGTPFLTRRLVAENAALYPDFLSNITAEDVRMRLFGAMRVDHDPVCAMAFIAVDEQSQKMLGAVRLHDDATMLAMCVELGFHVAGDPGLKTVTLPMRSTS